MQAFNAALPAKSTWPKHMHVAAAEIGVRELPGKADNPRIKEYQAATRLKDAQHGDATDWCGALVCWVLEQSGLHNPRYAMAENFQYYGDAVTVPQFGDIVVFTHHVAFFVRDIGADLEVLGGNQGNSVRYSHYPKERFIAFRRP